MLLKTLTNTTNNYEFFSRASDCHKKGQLITAREIEVYEHAYKSASFKSFDAYHDTIHSIWHTQVNRNDFNTSTCTCPEYFNSYVCKHIIGLAHQTKVIRIPNEAKARGIERKAAKGRPAKSKGAYKIQAPVVRPVELTETATLEPVEASEPQTSKKAATTTRKPKQPVTLEPVEASEPQTSKQTETATTSKRK